MSTNFPTAADNNTTLPNPGPGNFTDNPSHADQHANENDAIKAIQAKIGIGSSTPTSGKVFRGTGTGSSAWGSVDLTTDITGTLPVANGGTGLTALATGMATFLGTPSSANLRATVTDETGTGSLVFGTSPTITSPTISSPTFSNVDGWISLGSNLGTVTALGNRFYTAIVAGVDTTGMTSVGMRLKLPRPSTAPTRCTSLNGTNQYYSRTSANLGTTMTFTDDPTVSAWVYLTAYGATSAIASRFNGTSGWIFDIDSAGIVRLTGFNSSTSNFRRVQSYQSLPLNKWVHVAGMLDMSGNTYTTNGGVTNNYIMFDGLTVPGQMTQGGTNPTSLVQAGNLEIGSYNGGTQLWPGKIAQVAIYNARVTAATVRASMTQGLTGSETSLISAYSFDNSISDLNTTNANNLTANGSAVATNSDTPFTNSVTGINVTAGSTNYGIIMSQTFSTDTTYTIQVPEGETLPNTGTITPVSYSTQRAPYGFPVQKGKWRLESINVATTTKSSPTNGTWYNGDSTTVGEFSLYIPLVAALVGYEASLYGNRASAGVNSMYCCLSTTVAAIGELDLVARNFHNDVIDAMTTVKREKYVSSSAATTYYLNHMTDTTSMSTIGIFTSTGQGISRIYADNAYI